MIIFNEKLDFLFEQLQESTKRMNKAHKLPSVNGTTENMRENDKNMFPPNNRFLQTNGGKISGKKIRQNWRLKQKFA